jgi:glutaconyl-CoA/methylmalonyl-CoA decarboxylase subunit gamma
MIYKFDIDEQQFDVEIATVEKEVALVYVNGSPYTVNIENLEAPAPVASKSAPAPKAKAPAAPKSGVPAGAGVIAAPIPGLMIQIKVNVGDKVKAGQVVAIMEAMKMENDILAQVSGTVKEIVAQKGVEVSTGDVIMVIG